ncbi:predicted protein [Sparassis crispa]|uniref:Uncharacterized protein n=1 Tax=Sparassis crispa TaxID=139825 RepID=A0A401GGY5_9APHY|nr:predicted protein [Sparassis crispa]GBE81363.1 predicted protein [Sparassis crispa]
MAPKPNPLPLSDTLRDLALLRASDLDLSTVLPPSAMTSALAGGDAAIPDSDAASGSVNDAVKRSYEFAQEARMVLRLLNRGKVEKQGSRVEDVRSKLEDVLQGLDPTGRSITHYVAK